MAIFLLSLSIYSFFLSKNIKRATVSLICLVEWLEVVFVPCGHILCCKVYGSRCVEYLICRVLIDKILQIPLSKPCQGVRNYESINSQTITEKH